MNVATDRQPRCWIAVACAEHAQRGRDHAPVGFMQVCHGKGGPLRRLAPGDVIVYYAPSTAMGGKDRLQSFVSLGVVQPGQPYQADMGGGFVPFRRDVRYVPAEPAPILPLLDALAFVENRQRWGYPFRHGLFEVPARDMWLIAEAMQADPAALGLGACAAEGVEAKRVGREPNSDLLLRTVAVATAGKTGSKWDSSPPVAADALLPRRLLATMLTPCDAPTDSLPLFS